MTTLSGGVSDDVLEPAEAYKTKYRDTFISACGEYFDGLVKKSGVNAEENAKTVSEYNKKRGVIDEVSSSLKGYKGLKVFLIILIVISAIVAFAGIMSLVGGSVAAGSVELSVAVAVIIISSCVLGAYLSPKIKQISGRKALLEAEAERILQKAWEQAAPLNALFEDNVTKKLITKTVPQIKLDKYFDMRRYDVLKGKYGYESCNDINSSTTGILSGEIAGNPFALERKLVKTDGFCTYFGSLEIHWTTTHTDSNGKTVEEEHYQTLTASVDKPKPYYGENTRLIYANDAAPGLNFSRRPAHTERLSEEQIEGKVKRGAKKIRKKQEAQSGFTGLGNEEFDVLFGALDRNDEVQFRLLFTPLAQKNMLALLKGECGFGDDFEMVKSGCLNFIRSEHAAGFNFNESRTNYISYSVEEARKKFMDFNTAYFNCLYFDLAPLLSVPLYQQYKPREYIYSPKYFKNFPPQEAEYAVNFFGAQNFAPPGAATPSILKTELITKDGQSDKILVTSYAYRTVQRVDFVPVFGGDGYTHNVPVEWTEYIPVSKTEVAAIKSVGLSDREFMSEAGGGKYLSAVKKHILNGYGYNHGVLCCIIAGDDESFDRDFTLKDKNQED